MARHDRDPNRQARERPPRIPATRPTGIALAVLVTAALAAALALGFISTARAATGTEWQRVFGSANTIDEMTGLASAPNGGVYVVGLTGSPNEDALAIRYAATGRRVWARTYNDPADMIDDFSAATTDKRGDLVAVGVGNGSNTTSNILVAKYAPGGKRLWVRLFDDPSTAAEYASYVRTDAFGNVFVAGGNFGSGSETILVKYSRAGVRKWVRHYSGGGMGSSVGGMGLDGAGNVYLAGTHEDATGAADMLTLKYNPAGRRLWARTWNSADNLYDVAQAMAVARDGSSYAAGYTSTSTTGRATVLKYGRNGGLKWARAYAPPGGASYEGIALLHGGDIALGGVVDTNGSDGLIARLSPRGATRWVRAFNGPANSSDDLERLTVSPAGAIYLAGSTYSPTTSYDIVTVKYTGTGTFVWDKVYDAAGASDQQNASAVTFNAGVYVAGFQAGTNGSDGVTLRYTP